VTAVGTGEAITSTQCAGDEPASPSTPTGAYRRWIEPGAVGILTAAFFAFYAIYAVSRYKTYLTAGFDLGIFDQEVRAYAHFQAPIVTLKGVNYNVLGDHFSPILASLAPLYWIWNNPCMLLIAQGALLAASIPIVYRFARRRTTAPVAWFICGFYGIGWPFQAMIDFDFHEVAFAVPLMALAIDALDRRADQQLLICCGLLLLVREDMGALLIVLGIIRFFARGERPRWPAVSLVVGGAVAYVLTTTVIIPAFAQDHNFDYWQYQALGSNLPDAVGNIIVHPFHAVKTFFSPSEKSQTLGYLFIPLLFLPLRSRYLFVAIPLLAEDMFNSREHLWETHFHYNALPWTILVLAMIDGAARLGIFKPWPLRSLLIVWLVLVPYWMIQYDNVTPAAARRLIKEVAFIQTPEDRAAANLVSMIPSDTCVAVDDHLAPHLTRRDYVTLADTQYGTADFVALDFKYDSVGNYGSGPAYVYMRFDMDGYTVVYSHDGLVLMRSPDYKGPSAACRPFGPGKN
jgi:uncharacterized membrane protein